MAEQFYSNASQAGADQHSLSVGSIIHWVGTGISVALLAGGVYWAFSIASRDVTQIPVVSAQITPMREAPENPGGKATENQGLNVTQVAAMESGSNPVEQPADQKRARPEPVARDVMAGMIVSRRKSK